MFDLIIIKDPISIADLKQLAMKGFGDVIKAVIDVENETMAIGAELHVDMEVVLMEQENALRGNTWGINLYPEKTGEGFIEFDSMVNLKPGLGNRTRNVEDIKIQEKIKEIVGTHIKINQ